MARSISPKTDKARLAIGRRLRAAREREGLSLRAAAAAAKIRKGQWLRFEQGERSIPAELLRDLARAANTNASNLLAA